jgi:hypothetical protein
MRAGRTTSLPFWCVRPLEKNTDLNARVFRLAALALTLLVPAIAQVAILQIRFVDGEGAVHAPGSHSARPLTVEVTEETGKPVVGAAVSFHLPEDGAGAVFPNGMHTDVAMTDARGRVSMRGIQVGRVPGPFQIRVVAVKEQARAGVVSSQYVAETGSGAASPSHSAPAASLTEGHPRTRWLVIAAAVGGGAAAGMISAFRKSTPPATPTAPVAPAASAPSISIGTPVSTVGKP